MKIFTKLTTAFTLVATLSALAGLVGWAGIATLARSLQQTDKVNLPAVHGLGRMLEGMNAIQTTERTALISALHTKERSGELEKLEGLWAIFSEGYNHYASLPKSPGEKLLWENFQPTLSAWKEQHQQLVELAKAIELDDIHSLHGIVLEKNLDHKRWGSSLGETVERAYSASLSQGGGQDLIFLGELDPEQCAFGKWLKIFTSNSQAFNASLEKIKEPHIRLHGLGKEINNLLADGEAAKGMELYTAKVSLASQEIDALFQAILAVINADLEKLKQAVALSFSTSAQSFAEAHTLLDQLIAAQEAQTNAAVLAAEASANRSKLCSFLAMAGGGAIALLAGLFLARHIATPLHLAQEMLSELGAGHLDRRLRMKRQDEIGQMAASMDRFADTLQRETLTALAQLAAGDLTFEARPKDERDEVGNALKKTGADLNHLVGEINLATEQLATGATQVADANQNLSRGATESAASLEQISSAMTELAAQTNTNVANAKQANQLSLQAGEAAQHGNLQMESLMAAMAEINQSSQDISKIIKVIDEIAFQTNLLALNAAVEAARAGRQGKGFAVVAEEVRNLAARSAKAAQETAAMIQSSVEKAKKGGKIADRTAEALREIVAGATKVTTLVGEITAASSEQAEGIRQINEGLQQIDAITQENTASAEESAAAAQELSNLAELLRGLLARFKVKPSMAITPANPEFPPSTPPPPLLSVPAVPIIALDDKEFGKY